MKDAGSAAPGSRIKAVRVRTAHAAGGQGVGSDNLTTRPAAYYSQPELWELSRYEKDAAQRERIQTVISLIPAGVDSILDVGCGNGFVTRQLPARRVVGLDFSAEALAHFEGEAVLGSCDHLPFSDRSFDLVACMEVIEHLEPEAFMRTVKELARVAKSHV